ncbi:hypothetical protein [Corynebacterium stationis]|uniref:hypothetical protein n=1 Tax=Corynebacterium stationis TaxID=1705 RepID=UPI000952D17A|nr:hypothetical protein [Corynebacterium stationis]
MEERKLSSLFFGNVVLESGLMGTPVRIYSEDMRSYSFRPDSQTTLSVPLDELKGPLHAMTTGMRGNTGQPK